MKESKFDYRVTVHRHIPKTGLSEYYSATFAAESEKEAARLAIEDFKAMQPYVMAGEVLEVDSVTLERPDST